MHCTYRNMILGDLQAPNKRAFCFSDLLKLLLGGSEGTQKPKKVSYYLYYSQRALNLNICLYIAAFAVKPLIRLLSAFKA
jgi:hypothetical protein